MHLGAAQRGGIRRGLVDHLSRRIAIGQCEQPLILDGAGEELLDFHRRAELDQVRDLLLHRIRDQVGTAVSPPLTRRNAALKSMLGSRAGDSGTSSRRKALPSARFIKVGHFQTPRVSVAFKFLWEAR